MYFMKKFLCRSEKFIIHLRKILPTPNEYQEEEKIYLKCH